MTYRPDIDGLRGLAVALVLLYHVQLFFPGGFVGVDVFFVISGYLITGLLVRSIHDGSFSFLSFWARRVRRLAAPLLVVTAVTAVAGWCILLPEHLIDLGYSLLSQPLLLSNVYIGSVVSAGYFQDPPEIRPLLHTWSLGLEEQFYVLLPVLLVLVRWAAQRRAVAPAILGALGLGSFILCVSLTPLWPGFAYFSLASRAWELLLGGLLNFLPTWPARRALRELGSCAGLALLLFAALAFDHRLRFPGAFAVLPCFATALLILCNGSGPTVVGSLLSCRAAVAVGLLSYSLYLWHWPLVAFTQYLGLMAPWEARLAVLAASVVLGYLSWRWLERPVRQGRWLPGRTHMLGLFIVYMLLCFGFGGLFVRMNGFPENWSPAARRLAAVKVDSGWMQRTGVDLCKPGSVRYIGAQSPTRARVLLWGDSHAASLVPVLDLVGKAWGVKIVQASKVGMRGILPQGATGVELERWADYALHQARVEKVELVILASRWTAVPPSELRRRLAPTIVAFQSLGAEVAFVGDVPHLRYEAPRLAACRTRFSFVPQPAVERRSYQRTTAAIRKILDDLPGVDKSRLHILDLAPTIMGWEVGARTAHELLYADGHHLTPAGAVRLRPLFRPLFARLSTPPQALPPPRP